MIQVTGRPHAAALSFCPGGKRVYFLSDSYKIKVMCRVLTYTAKNTDNGKIARDIIHREFHLVAHDIARAKYETENGITINGEQVMINHVVTEGDVLRVRLEDRPGGKIVPSEGPLEIMYEDEDLICLNKPAGIVVHPSHGHFSDSLANYLAFHYEQTGDPHEIRTIGRLDKDTSGLIFYGKSRTVCAHMMEQADRGEREKFYLALAEGVFQSKTGTIDEPISREFDDQIKRVVREGGDRAVTHYRVVRQYADYALVRVTIDTGRTHQIRVHMAHIGHPLLGDPLYGRGETGERVVFRQPFSGEYLELQAPLPDDMKHFLSE